MMMFGNNRISRSPFLPTFLPRRRRRGRCGSVFPDNELNTYGVYTYTHDAEGNRTEKFLWADVDSDGVVDASEKTLVQSYSWDYRNRLVGVTNYVNGVASTTVAYGYDYLNQMITGTVGTTTETFVYGKKYYAQI